MSTSADESGQAISAELSEADRAAWLRIERALRGMRWWWLLLASAFALSGASLAIELIAGVMIHLANKFSLNVKLVAFTSLSLAFSMALIVLGVCVLRIYTSVWKSDAGTHEAKLGCLLKRQQTAWVVMTASAAVIACVGALKFLSAFGLLPDFIH